MSNMELSSTQVSRPGIILNLLTHAKQEEEITCHGTEKVEEEILESDDEGDDEEEEEEVSDSEMFREQVWIVDLCVRRVLTVEDELELADVYSEVQFEAMKLRREIIIYEECEKGRLHIPAEILRNVISFVYPEEHSVERECMRVGCDAIAAPSPDPRSRANIYDDFTCNNAACNNRCYWYEKVGQAFVRCAADRSVNARGRRASFCNHGWCKTLYKANGGTTQRAFTELKHERENNGEHFG